MAKIPPPKAQDSPKKTSVTRSSRRLPPNPVSSISTAAPSLHRGWVRKPMPGKKIAAAYRPPRAAPAASRSRRSGSPASFAAARSSR